MATLPTISVCLIVKDEEANLRRALESTRGVADELVVVDAGSKDRSKEIAREFGATVGEYAWTDDFSAARNKSLELARNDWVLVMDADEALTPQMASALKPYLAKVTAQDGLIVRLRNVGAGEAQVLRLFRNHRGYRFRGRIHESVAESITSAGGRLLVSELLVLDHFGYVEEEHRRKDRRARNLALLQREHAERPDDSSILHHLAIEHLVQGDLSRAEPLLRRVVAEFPDTLLAGGAAARLAYVLFQSGRHAEGWDVAHRFTSAPVGGVDCTFLEGACALELGDPVVAEAAARALLQGAKTFGELYTQPAQARTLLARALWRRGAKAEALELWRLLLEESPDDGARADAFVLHLSALHGLAGLKAQGLTAVRSPQVAGAVVARMMALGDAPAALELAARLGQNRRFRGFHGQMLFAASQWARAAELLQPAAPEDAHLLALCGLILGREPLLSQARAQLTPASAEAIAALLGGGPPGEKARQTLIAWVEQCLRLGARDALELLASTAYPDVKERSAHLARAAATLELIPRALELAARGGDHPFALEVLAAHAGDPVVRQAALARRLAQDRPPLWIYAEAAKGSASVAHEGLARYPHAKVLGL